MTGTHYIVARIAAQLAERVIACEKPILSEQRRRIARYIDWTLAYGHEHPAEAEGTDVERLLQARNLLSAPANRRAASASV